MQYLIDNWIGVFGIVSVIFSIGLTYGKFKDFDFKITEMKKENDTKITTLFDKYAEANAKIEFVKDDLSRTITTIQLDIREIMTMLKAGK